MNSVSEVFDALGGPSQVARLLGVRQSTASEMKRRGSIPAEYWSEIVEVARQRNLPGLNSERLSAIHSRLTKKAVSPESGTVAEAGFSESPTAYQPDTGHFSRFKYLRRSHFQSIEEVNSHIRALRDEWDRR